MNEELVKLLREQFEKWISAIEAIGLVLATLNLDDAYPAQRELLREVLEDAKKNQEAEGSIMTRLEFLLGEKKEWVGLTDEERTELWWNTDMSGMPEHDYGKAIEAKLREKNI